MHVELQEDANATRALHVPIMAFKVHLKTGEEPTATERANLEALAHSAALAWEDVHDDLWEPPRQ
jgi:hypothetical protein